MLFFLLHGTAHLERSIDRSILRPALQLAATTPGIRTNRPSLVVDSILLFFLFFFYHQHHCVPLFGTEKNRLTPFLPFRRSTSGRCFRFRRGREERGKIVWRFFTRQEGQKAGRRKLPFEMQQRASRQREMRRETHELDPGAGRPRKDRRRSLD